MKVWGVYEDFDLGGRMELKTVHQTESGAKAKASEYREKAGYSPTTIPGFTYPFVVEPLELLP